MKDAVFDAWFDEVEGFATRGERLADLSFPQAMMFAFQAGRASALPQGPKCSEASLREIDLALAAMADLKPLTEYGEPGTYDTVQARRRTALKRAEGALLYLRRELAAAPAVTAPQDVMRMPDGVQAFDPARQWEAHQHSPGHWSVARTPLPGQGVIEYLRGTGNLSANEAKRIAAQRNAGVNAVRQDHPLADGLCLHGMRLDHHCASCAAEGNKQTAASKDVMRQALEAPEGWRFYSADFSVNAANPKLQGRVTLIRDMPGVRAWHALTEEQQMATPLYVSGEGITFSEALKDAADAALSAAISADPRPDQARVSPPPPLKEQI